MKVKEENIVKLIKEFDLNKLEAINLIYGKEEFLKKQLINKIKKNRPDSFHFLWGDETSIERLKEIFSSSSLFSSGETAIVWDVDSFISKIGKGGLEEFLKLVKSIRLPNRLILVSTKDKLPKKEPYSTLLETAEIIVSPSLTSRAFMVSVKKKIEREGISIDDETLLYLLSKLKNDLYYAKQEVEKLILLTRDKKKIEKEDIDSVIFPKVEENVFKFIEKFFKRESEAIGVLRTLMETSHHPFEIQSLILTYLNRILLFKELKSKNTDNDSIFNRMGISHPYMKSTIKKLSESLETEEIIGLIKDLYNLELKQKVYFEEPEKSLEEFVVKWIV